MQNPHLLQDNALLLSRLCFRPPTQLVSLHASQTFSRPWPHQPHEIFGDPHHCLARLPSQDLPVHLLTSAGLTQSSSPTAEPARQLASAPGYSSKPPHARSSAHQAWLTLLGLATSLLLALPREEEIQQLGVRLVVTGHARLVQALLPPQGSPEQPLTLAALQVGPA